MTRTTHPIASGRPLHNRPFFDMLTVRLVSYAQVWVGREDYLYECTWSDGQVTTEGALPWGLPIMVGAVDLGIARDPAHPLPDHLGTDDWEDADV